MCVCKPVPLFPLIYKHEKSTLNHYLSALNLSFLLFNVSSVSLDYIIKESVSIRKDLFTNELHVYIIFEKISVVHD